VTIRATTDQSLILERLARLEEMLRPSQQQTERLNRLLELAATPTVNVRAAAGSAARLDAVATALHVRQEELNRRHDPEMARIGMLMSKNIDLLSDEQLQERFEREEDIAMRAMALAQRTRHEIERRKDAKR
jgi:hypothetical protein